MELHQIRYFLALHETKNFTRAAERCHVSQPSLTRAVKALEDELHGALIHRERNNTHLTDLGRLMLPYFQEVYTHMSAVKQRARAFADLKEAPLSVGIMCTIGPGKLVNLFSEFHDAHPDIDLHIRDGRAQDLQALLAAGELDLAIYGLPDDDYGDQIHAQPLFTESFIIIIAPGHRFAQMKAVRFRDLHDERYLGRSKCEVMEKFLRLADKLGVKPKQPYLSERDDWVEAMVRAGWGFSFFPEYATTAPDLVRRPLIEPEFKRTVNLVTVRGRPYAPAVGAFVRVALQHRWTGTSKTHARPAAA